MPTLFERWADQQGVRRPFDALVEMEEASRRQIAELLGFGLEDAVDEASVQARYDLGEDDEPLPPIDERIIAQAESCVLIGSDGVGIQARSASASRKLNPFASNHTWREILLSITEEFQVPLPDSYPSEEALEAAIFEYTAQKTWEKMEGELKQEIEAFLTTEKPEFREQLGRKGVGPNGIRLMAAGVFTAAKAGGFGTYITAAKAAAFINRKTGMKLVMHRVTGGLGVALRGLSVLLWISFAAEILGYLFGSSRGRLLPVVAAIHQHHLLTSFTEEAEPVTTA